jgi:hypothetical protein
LPRHKGRYGLSTSQDLKDKIDNDPWLGDQASSHIILAHDQVDIHDVTKDVIDHMIKRGFQFS